MTDAGGERAAPRWTGNRVLALLVRDVMSRLLALIPLAVTLVSCAQPTSGAAPGTSAAAMPGFVGGACRQTPDSPPLGMASGNLAVRPDPVLIPGQLPKFLWFVRVPHRTEPLRLTIDRLDGPGVGRVVTLNAVRGPMTDLPAGWERAVAFASNLMFDQPGCWRIRDADGTAEDAIVIEIHRP